MGKNGMLILVAIAAVVGLVLWSRRASAHPAAAAAAAAAAPDAPATVIPHVEVQTVAGPVAVPVPVVEHASPAPTSGPAPRAAPKPKKSKTSLFGRIAGAAKKSASTAVHLGTGAATKLTKTQIGQFKKGLDMQAGKYTAKLTGSN